MKFTVNREVLLKPLTVVAGAVERRQTLPILSNLLIVAKGKKVFLTGTDLEVELKAEIPLEEKAEANGKITVPARKLLDICKSLPDETEITLSIEDEKAILRSGRSRYSLATLAADDYPAIEEDEAAFSITLNQKAFRELIEKTAFSMAQQDVRYYLNGMLWELNKQSLKAVSTDGHRLAIAEVPLQESLEEDAKQYIIPRKGVLELSRLLGDDAEAISLEFGGNHIKASSDNLTFTSKLVDGKFPDYRRVLPKGGNKVLEANRQDLKSALTRSAILSNEKFRGIRFSLSTDMVGIQANNPEQEEAHEEVSVSYAGDSLEMGFNVSYLIDVLGVLHTENVKFIFSDSNSSVLIQDCDESNNAMYVVMPMRL